LAVDIPSGLHANMPLEDADAVLKANHTLTFQNPKLAFFLPETGVFVPYFEVLDIGLDPQFLSETEPLAQLIGKVEAQQFYKQRAKYDHKGIYGHALIVGGSYGKMGAAVLSSRAALKIGAGMVTVFSPKCGYNILQTVVPEAMVLSDKTDDHISEINTEFIPSSIGVGIGMGTHAETISAIKTLFKTTKSPMVIDADALNAISISKEVLKLLPKLSILTPHVGELKRLLGGVEK